MRLTLSQWSSLLVLTLYASACAPPSQGAAGRGAGLAVGIANPPSVELLDDRYRRHRSALAGSPVQLAAGPGGGVVALSAASAGGGRPELAVSATGGASNGHAAGRRLAGLDTSGIAQLATDGQRYAVVAYERRQGDQPAGGTASRADRCALLLVDLTVGEPVSAALPCGGEESVRSLALEPAGDAGGAGVVKGDGSQPAIYAYVGLEGTRSGSENGPGRLAIVALPSGAVVGSLPLAGTPVDLRLGARSRGEPAALYVLEQSGGAGGIVPTPERGRVVVLDPLTLEVLGEHTLSGHASRLVSTSDGRSAFLVQQDTVQRLDLTTGQVRQIARLPRRVVAAEIRGDRLYLGSPEAQVLWVLDARTGHRQPDVRVPGHPVSLALAMPGAG
jgi:hypothetical protein